MEINENQRKSMEIIHGNPWKLMKIRKKFMEINAKLTVLQWSRGGLAVVLRWSRWVRCGFAAALRWSRWIARPMKIHANPWKSMEIYGN